MKLSTLSRCVCRMSVLAIGLSSFSVASIAQTSFTPGNLIVYRTGTGSGSLTNAATAVFLDEYTISGTLVQSIALPTAVSGNNKRLTASGTATSEGYLTLSTDGRYILLTGYDAALGTSDVAGTTSASVNRVVGRTSFSGVFDTTTALTSFSSAANIRSAVSTNGTNVWIAGAANSIAFATVNPATPTTSVTTLTSSPTNFRVVNIFNGQLYASSGSGTTRIATIGTGTPTSATQTVTNLASPGSPYGFYFADLSAGVAGVDTLYVADDSNGSSGGILKYSLVSGTWTSNGRVDITNNLSYRGLTGTTSGTTVTLYATRNGTNLVKLMDTAGYNTAPSATITQLATAATNTAIRGVAFAPTVYVTPSISSVTPTSISAGSAATTITVNGTDFGHGISKVQWGGLDLTTTFVSATQLTATVPSNYLSKPGYAKVSVSNTGSAIAESTVVAITETPANNTPNITTSIARVTKTATQVTVTFFLTNRSTGTASSVTIPAADVSLAGATADNPVTLSTTTVGSNGLIKGTATFTYSPTAPATGTYLLRLKGTFSYNSTIGNFGTAQRIAVP